MLACSLTLNEETEKFLKKWREKTLSIIDPFNNVFDSSKWTNYMPSFCDGSITMFCADGDKEILKITGNRVALKKIGNEWLTWYFIQ